MSCTIWSVCPLGYPYGLWTAVGLKLGFEYKLSLKEPPQASVLVLSPAQAMLQSPSGSVTAVDASLLPQWHYLKLVEDQSFIYLSSYLIAVFQTNVLIKSTAGIDTLLNGHATTNSDSIR